MNKSHSPQWEFGQNFSIFRTRIHKNRNGRWIWRLWAFLKINKQCSEHCQLKVNNSTWHDVMWHHEAPPPCDSGATRSPFRCPASLYWKKTLFTFSNNSIIWCEALLRAKIASQGVTLTMVPFSEELILKFRFTKLKIQFLRIIKNYNFYLFLSNS